MSCAELTQTECETLTKQKSQILSTKGVPMLKMVKVVCTLLVNMESNLHLVMELKKAQYWISDHARSKKRNNFLRIQNKLINYISPKYFDHGLGSLSLSAPPNANNF